MTTGDGWAAAVRDRLAPGRLLPLGTAADGAWIAERAVREVLGRAASAVPGVVPGVPRVHAEETRGVRVTAEFGAVAGRPLPELADALRAALLGAAEEGLGLVVAAVDLRVTELIDEAAEAAGAPEVPEPGRDAPPAGRPAPATDDPVALAVLGVEGVAGVTDALGPPVLRTGDGGVRVELAVAAGHRALETARAARAAATAAAPEGAAVMVLVSELR